jgi:hypothetical protein
MMLVVGDATTYSFKNLLFGVWCDQIHASFNTPIHLIIIIAHHGAWVLIEMAFCLFVEFHNLT